MMMAKGRKYFISGLVVFLPVVLTVYVLVLLVRFSDGLLGKHLQPIFIEQFGFYPPGLGMLVGFLTIIFIGFFATNFLGRRVFKFFEGMLLKLPFVRQVYPAIKEMAVFLFSGDQIRSFKQVVLIEYPRKGIYSFAFLTNDSAQHLNEKVHRELCNVFVPSAPGPLTGFVMMVPKKDIIFTDIRIEEAIKFIVSGGVVNPRV